MAMQKILIAAMAFSMSGAVAAEDAKPPIFRPAPSDEVAGTTPLSQMAGVRDSSATAQPAGEAPKRSEESESSSEKSEKVLRVQQALREKGYDPGEANGEWGSKTWAALRDYQKAQGLQATAKMDEATLGALGVREAGRDESGRPSYELLRRGAAGPAQADTQTQPLDAGATNFERGRDGRK